MCNDKWAARHAASTRTCILNGAITSESFHTLVEIKKTFVRSVMVWLLENMGCASAKVGTMRDGRSEDDVSCDEEIASNCAK